jgi:hypothetical protein
MLCNLVDATRISKTLKQRLLEAIAEVRQEKRLIKYSPFIWKFLQIEKVSCLYKRFIYLL